MADIYLNLIMFFGYIYEMCVVVPVDFYLFCSL